MERKDYVNYYQGLSELFMPEEVRRIFCRIPSQWSYLLEMALVETAKTDEERAIVLGSHEKLTTHSVESVFRHMEASGIRFDIQQQRLIVVNSDNVLDAFTWYRKFLKEWE